MRNLVRRVGVTSVAVLMLLGACTARLPADVALVSVRAAQSGLYPAAVTAGPPPRLLEVSFASRVNLQRFVTVNGYSLDVEADFCDGAAPQALVVSGLYWQGQLLDPGARDPIHRNDDDDLLDYTFFLDAGKAAAGAGDICFNIAGGNEDRGYRSNTVVIPRVEIALALNAAR